MRVLRAWNFWRMWTRYVSINCLKQIRETGIDLYFLTITSSDFLKKRFCFCFLISAAIEAVQEAFKCWKYSHILFHNTVLSLAFTFLFTSSCATYGQSVFSFRLGRWAGPFSRVLSGVFRTCPILRSGVATPCSRIPTLHPPLRFHHGGHTGVDVFRRHGSRLPLLHYLHAMMRQTAVCTAERRWGFLPPASLITIRDIGTLINKLHAWCRRLSTKAEWGCPKCLLVFNGIVH